MATHLLKTEPSTYSFDDLVREKRARWDGVSNAAALINLRAIRKGDDLLIYHSGEDKAVVGLARALSDAYEDPARPGTTPDGRPKFAVVDLAPLKGAKTPVTLAAIKADARFKELGLVRISRLSVMPVPAPMDRALRVIAGL
ncbi:MAG TPA: EVE domain-containing protein [Phycisphaerales bacterium]|nr:EVE domain-containing protein [Phycisphaerales bacterium]